MMIKAKKYVWNNEEEDEMKFFYKISERKERYNNEWKKAIDCRLLFGGKKGKNK